MNNADRLVVINDIVIEARRGPGITTIILGAFSRDWVEVPSLHTRKANNEDDRNRVVGLTVLMCIDHFLMHV